MKRETIIKDASQAMAFLCDVNVYPCKITITDDIKHRSLSANAAQHVFYKEIASYTGEDIKTSGNRMKRDIGLPILLSGEYGKKVSWMLDCMSFYSREDSKQVNMMDLIPVTSLFTSREHTIYRENLIAFWADNGVNLSYER